MAASAARLARGGCEPGALALRPDPLAWIPTERLHGIDHLRAILMCLGVVLHSANVFSAEGGWKVWDAANATPWADYLNWPLRLVRMPAFFLIAGLLFALSVRRHGVARVLLLRLQRLGIPLVAVLGTLNVCECAVQYHFSTQQLAFPAFFWQELMAGRWLGHLWFLVYLLGYVLLAAFAYRWFERGARAFPVRALVLVVPLAPVFPLALHALAKAVPVLAVPVAGLCLLDWLDFIPYFTIGFLLGFRQDLLRAFPRWSLWQAPAAIAAAFLLAGSKSWFDGLGSRAITIYTRGFLAWCAILLFLFVAQRWLSRPVASARLVSEAAYTIFLFHHFVVVSVGYLVIHLDWPLLVEASLLGASAIGIPLALHSLIRRHSTLRFLFNGDLRPRPVMPLGDTRPLLRLARKVGFAAPLAASPGSPLSRAEGATASVAARTASSTRV